jgi:polar amino acid transport system substrate-binding protein
LVFSTSRDGLIQEVSERVMVEAYAKLGYEVEVLGMPIARALLTSNAGKVDGELSRVKAIAKKYKNLLRIPVAINSIQGYAFARRTDLLITDWQSLRPYRLVCVRGVEFIEMRLRKFKLNCQYVSKFTQAIDVVQSGRADIAVLPKVAGMHAIRELEGTQVRAIGEALATLDLYHFLHIKNAAIAPRLLVVLTEMQKTGRIANIRDEFIRENNF